MINFQLVSTKGTRFDGEVYEVLVPAQDGTIALFEDHMPLISACHPGVISIRKKSTDPDDDMENFAVSGGVAQIDGKNVHFLSDDVTTPEDISEAEAEAAHKLAQQMAAQASTQTAINESNRVLLYSQAKLHIARLKKRRHP